MTKKTNRNLFICSVAGILLLATGSFAWSKGIADVAKTVHNLSTSQPLMYGPMYKAKNVDEICVFCHTPHGGLLTGPLWNHSMPSTTSFTHYNSATLSTKIVDDKRPISNESLLCMACHDGSVAVNHVINAPNSINGAYINMGLADGTPVPIVPIGAFPGARIGATSANLGLSGDLSDDHPISFSYNEVLTDGAYGLGGSKEGELHPVAYATDPALGDVRFFGATNRVECSSCHDPHVDYVTQQADYAPFLIRPNTGSALCLACHNK